jgi:ATP-dependent DNA helicase DinG
MKANNKLDSVQLGMLAQDALNAHIGRVGGESRPQQEEMVTLVSQTFAKSICSSLIQAGTGTGKSLAYLFPSLLSGQRTVIATATNQLSEQLYKQDLPEVADTIEIETKKKISYALLKGRNNYACLAKISGLKNLDEEAQLFTDSDYGGYDDSGLSSDRIKQAREDAKLVGELVRWSDSTDTGDRSDATPVVDRVWKQVSVSSSECPGASNCPFGNVCFTEIARKKAKAADIVITNHALLAQEASQVLDSPEESEGKPSVFGEYQNLVIDEAHDFADSLSGASTSEINPKEISKFVTKSAQYLHLADNVDSLIADKTKAALDLFIEELNNVESNKSFSIMPEDLAFSIKAVLNNVIMIQSTLSKESAKANKSGNAGKAINIEILSNASIDIATALADALLDRTDRVRWVERRGDDKKNPLLKVAPLEVGEQYKKIASNKSVLLTSATLSVAGDFTPIRNVLGLSNQELAVDVGSPFDYPKLGMLYIPNSDFPEPIGKDREAHTAAVLSELYDLIQASGGRTLALFTTTAGAQRAAEYLREKITAVNIYAHGDAPADVLVQNFREDETSILCATMGLWQGTNVPGPACSLVVIDKVGFAPIDDVLTNARRELANSQKRNGFNDVVVAQAATSLAQAAGRLIRTSTDRGVVAILDPRLRSKNYGSTLIKSLPNFKVFSDKKVVLEALNRLTGGIENVPQKPDNGIKVAKPKSNGRQGEVKIAPKSKLVRSSYKKNLGKR